MTDNHTPPTPEEMGAKLDEDIKETVKDWAKNPENTDFDELDDRIDVKLRRTVAGWVGAGETAGWKEIGDKMDSKTRSAIAGWVGAEKDADWQTITNQIETRTRSNIARLVHADRPDGEVRWSDIGSKVERDVRGWIGGLVGTSKDADWQTIGNQIVDKVRHAAEKVTKSDKPGEPSDADVQRAASRIEITSEDDDQPPAVKSSKPIDPAS